MDARGYRAQTQPDDQTAELPAAAERGVPLATAGLGALAVLATAAAILLVMQLGAGGSDKPDQAAAPDAPSQASDLAGQETSYGPAGAPVQVMAMPGTCEGHTQMVANLKALSQEYPDELYVDILPMSHPKAAAEGCTCASYLMKIEGRLEPDATPGGYTLLAEKGPGVNWTPESVTEQIREALDDARKARKRGSPGTRQSGSPANTGADGQAGESHSH